MAGGPFQGPNDILVDNYIARQKHVKVGDTMEVLNHNFRVAGIVENGRGARKFLPIAALQDLIGAKDKASVFYLKLDDPANADEVVKEVKSQPGMEKYTVQSTDEYLSMMTPSRLPVPAIHWRGDWGEPDHRLSGDFPVDVCGGDGAHARDRDTEGHGRIEGLHRDRDSAGDWIAGRGRNRAGHSFQSGRELGSGIVFRWCR